MASELANRIAYAVLSVDADQPSPEIAIDAQLQEVREVLALFEEEWMTPHDYEHEIRFLPKGIPCDECDLSQRARQLADRLRVR